MKKVLVQFSFPGVTSKQYDQVWDELRKAGFDHPQGLVHHTSAQQGNNWIVVDVWESENHFKKFGETLMPILKKVNVPSIQPIVSPVYYELVNEVHA